MANPAKFDKDSVRFMKAVAVAEEMLLNMYSPSQARRVLQAAPPKADGGVGGCGLTASQSAAVVRYIQQDWDATRRHCNPQARLDFRLRSLGALYGQAIERKELGVATSVQALLMKAEGTSVYVGQLDTVEDDDEGAFDAGDPSTWSDAEIAIFETTGQKPEVTH